MGFKPRWVKKPFTDPLSRSTNFTITFYGTPRCTVVFYCSSYVHIIKNTSFWERVLNKNARKTKSLLPPLPPPRYRRHSISWWLLTPWLHEIEEFASRGQKIQCGSRYGGEKLGYPTPNFDRIWLKYIGQSAREVFITQRESFCIRARRPSRQRSEYVWSLLCSAIVILFISILSYIIYIFTWSIFENVHLIPIHTYISKALKTN